MPKRTFEKIFAFIGFLFDVGVVFGSFWLAYWIRLKHDPLQFLNLADVPPLILNWRDYLQFSFYFSLLYLLVFVFKGFYDGRERRLWRWLSLVVSAANQSLILIMIFTFFRGALFYSRLLIFYTWFFIISFVFLERALLRRLKKFFWERGIGVKKILVVGTDILGQQLLEGFRHNLPAGTKVMGVLAGKSQVNLAHKDTAISGFRVLGNLSDFEQVVRRLKINEVIFTLSDLEKGLGLIEYCRESGIKFKFVPDMLHFMSSYATVGTVNGLPLVTFKDTPLKGINCGIKRSLDIIGSFLGLIVLSPLFLILALLIKLTSKGPVFFLQERVGLDNKIFSTIKFRSMYVESELDPINRKRTWTVEGDERITPVGHLMRKTNLDEIPQLWNVLKGEMSLVGPRPEQKAYVEKFKKKFPRYLERHKVKAGLTGWAQINGLRGDTSIEERLKYDIYYVENWSLLFDLKIILQTLFLYKAVKHAY